MAGLLGKTQKGYLAFQKEEEFFEWETLNGKKITHSLRSLVRLAIIYNLCTKIVMLSEKQFNNVKIIVNDILLADLTLL